MTVRLKVLFLASWYPSRVHPVSGIFIKRHIETIARFCDAAALYVVADPNLNDKTYEVEYAEENTIRTIRVYYRLKDFKISAITQLIWVVRYIIGGCIGLRMIKSKFGWPGIVHLNVVEPAGVFALLLKRLKGIPYIVTEHWSGYLPADGSYDKKGLLRKLRRFITRLTIKQAEAVTTVSSSLKDAMLKHGLKNNYFVVPNIVDTDLFHPSGSTGTNSTKTILHVSLLSQEKNIPGILRAIKKLSLIRRDFELHIIGNDLEKRLEYLAGELELEGLVFFHGLMPSDKVADHMRRADFFLMFSNYENSPCVILEAMASGLPVIATNIGGIPEHITSENGILVQPADESGLVSAIMNMLDNLHVYDGKRIRQYALSHFSSQVVAKQFKEIYDKVQANKSPSR